MKHYTLLLALASLSLATTSCSKDKSDEPQVAPSAEEVKTFTIDATKNNQYLYFSFEKGNLVATTKWDDTDIPNRTDWDLAFHKYEFRTNSGLSGKGQGGAYETSVTDIKAPIVLPAANAFGTDTDKQLQLVDANHATRTFTYQELPINHVLSATIEYTQTPGSPAPSQKVTKPGALTFYFERVHNPNGTLPAYVLNNKVYIIRTGTGKFAKFKVTGYQAIVTDATSGKTETKTGHITFEYVYPVQ